MRLDSSDYYRLCMLASGAAVEISYKLTGREINYKPIKELSKEIDKVRIGINEKHPDITALFIFYESITGINLREMVGKTKEEIEEACKEQEQKTGYYCSSDTASMVKNLEAYLTLKTIELNSIDSLPREKLENMTQFCVTLSRNSGAESHVGQVGGYGSPQFLVA